MQFLFYDENSDTSFSIGDRLIVVCGDSLGKSATPGNYRTTWAVQMYVDTTAGALRLPTGGDVFRIATTKPFRTGETFQFKVRSQSEDKEKAKSDMEHIAVVPNPYVGAASWEPPNLFRSGRGERRIYFIHLPRRCTIRVFTVSGALVTTIEHDAAIDNGQESWNLVSKDGMDISYGIYVYHVEAPGVGEKIGKFAVIK
jgi:hypothetical protein